MRRIMMLVAVATLMVVSLSLSGGPAFAVGTDPGEPAAGGSGGQLDCGSDPPKPGGYCFFSFGGGSGESIYDPDPGGGGTHFDEGLRAESGGSGSPDGGEGGRCVRTDSGEIPEYECTGNVEPPVVE